MRRRSMRAVSTAAVLRLPGVARLLATSLAGRLPGTALGLLLVLRVRDLGGSYALGGLVSGAFALGLAAGSPLLGRAVDARGQTRVLAAAATLAAATLGALAALRDGAPPAALVALAALCGAVQPPLAACLRALWGRMLPDADARHAILAAEASLQELTFIAGPLLLVSLVAARSPRAGLALAAALLLAGTAAFAATPESRGARPHAARPPGRAGALGSPGVRTLLAVGAALGAAFGAIEIGVVAAAEHAGARGAAGLLFAVWGAGSLAGGLLAARRGAASDAPARLVALLAALTAAHALLALAPGPWALGALLALAGALIAPLFAVLYALVGEVARAGTVTEAFAWLTTGIGAGLALGSASAGALATAGGPAAPFLVAAAMTGGGAMLARARARTLRAHRGAGLPEPARRDAAWREA
jgi:MFS family permease